MESLNLKKGMSLDLKKHENLKVMDVCLGWQTTYDLDSIAFLVDDTGKIVETVCYQNLNGRGVSLNGDDTRGGGTGDNEIITIKFDKLKSNVQKIILCANIYGASPSYKGLFGKFHEGDNFSKVKGSFIRLVNAETNQELCKYDLTEDGKDFNAFHFADLEKINDEWSFKAIGVGMNGAIADLKHQLDGSL